MLKYRTGDTVKIKAGKDKGREGKIEKINPLKMLALIPEVNLYKKHVKAAMAGEGKGGVYDLPRPLPLSKLALVCPNCKKVTRVGIRVLEDEKVRFCKKCGKEIDKK